MSLVTFILRRAVGLRWPGFRYGGGRPDCMIPDIAPALAGHGSLFGRQQIQKNSGCRDVLREIVNDLWRTYTKSGKMRGTSFHHKNIFLEQAWSIHVLYFWVVLLYVMRSTRLGLCTFFIVLYNKKHTHTSTLYLISFYQGTLGTFNPSLWRWYHRHGYWARRKKNIHFDDGHKWRGIAYSFR